MWQIYTCPSSASDFCCIAYGNSEKKSLINYVVYGVAFNAILNSKMNEIVWWAVTNNGTCKSKYWCGNLQKVHSGICWQFRKAGTVINFRVSDLAQKIFIILWTHLRHTVYLYSVFVKQFFLWNFYRFLKKLCFEPKEIAEKSSNGRNFQVFEHFGKVLPCRVLGQKIYGVTSCSIFYFPHIWNI
jgi:hypothetical protein